MATRPQRQRLGYGVSEALINLYSLPIVAQRAPTTNDQAAVGTIWIDQPNDDAYILTKVSAGTSTWINTGGGAGVFTTVTTTGAITCGTALSVGTTLDVTGNTTLNTGAGALLSSAAGLVTASAGTNGQILCGSTGTVPAWTSITSATLVITPGAGTLNIEESGGTANSFVTDIPGPVVPLLGVTTIAGGSNITTDGSVANTITFNLDDNVAVAGFLAAGVNLSMLTGVMTIAADTDVANAIYLQTNGGTNETILLENVQGTSVSAIELEAVAGGIAITSGLAAAGAIGIDASDAAGGIACDFGTGGMIITGANGAFTVETGTGNVSLGADAVQKAIVIGNATGNTSVALNCGTGACNVGTSATAHTTTVGSTTGASSLVLQGGTGDVIVTSTDDITMDCAGVFEINSTAGAISIGGDADDFALNLGTAGERVVTIGNISGATQVVINSGTAGIQLASTGAGDISIISDDTFLLDADGVIELNSSAGIISVGNDADDFGINVGSAGNRPIVIGAVGGTSALSLYSGSGNTAIDSDGTIIVDGGGVVEINSDGGDISIASDADDYDVYLGIAGTRAVSIGSAAATSAVDVNCGTGGASFGATATAHTTTIGSTNTTSDTTIQSGSGGISLEAAGIVDVVPVTDTQAGAATTADANVGVVTHTGLTTAAGASQVLTVTNSVCAATSAILCTLAVTGAEDAQCTVQKVTPGVGSFTVTYKNNGAASLASDLILTFWILA